MLYPLSYEGVREGYPDLPDASPPRSRTWDPPIVGSLGAWIASLTLTP